MTEPTPDTGGRPEPEPLPEPECVTPAAFLKAEVVLRPSDGQKLGAIWFQEDGLSGGRIVKFGLTLAGLDDLMRAVADVAARIETGID